MSMLSDIGGEEGFGLMNENSIHSRIAKNLNGEQFSMMGPGNAYFMPLDHPMAKSFARANQLNDFKAKAAGEHGGTSQSLHEASDVIRGGAMGGITHQREMMV